MPSLRQAAPLVALLLALPLGLGTLIVPPIKTGPEAVLIVLQGAKIPAAAYRPLIAAVQAASPLAVWGALPEAPMDLALPPEVDALMEGAFAALRGAGCRAEAAFAAGHSLGGVTLQGWAARHPARLRGQILMGSALLRKYRNASYPVPTAVVSATLDGQFPVTRVAEEYYHRVRHAEDPKEAGRRFPVVVVPGMSHMQFASGPPPPAVQAGDLAPAIPLEAAHRAVGGAVARFIEVQLSGDPAAATALASLVAAAGRFFGPLLATYEMEGSRHFNRPAQIGGPQQRCPKGGCEGGGSPWVIRAQSFIGDTERLASEEGWNVTVTNQYVALTSFPPFGTFHLPSITRDEDQLRSFAVHTFAQGAWAAADSLDVGSPNCATELGAKLVSRQCVLTRGANHTDVPFAVDDPDFCAQLNSQAYTEALAAAPSDVRQRFQAKGVPLTFDPDAQRHSGPTWIYDQLQFDMVDAPSAARRTARVVSPALKTSADNALSSVACYHYCKLLSPARAMGWIYVEGLRYYGGLTPPAPPLLTQEADQ